MSLFENDTHASGRVCEATDWFSYFEAGLYSLDCRLWEHQKYIAAMRGAVNKMRSAIPTDTATHLRGEGTGTHQIRTDNTPACKHSHSQPLDLAKSSEPSNAINELMEASLNDSNEIAAHFTGLRRSTASDTNVAGVDVGVCRVVGCVAHLQQLQSAMLADPEDRVGSADARSEEKRIKLRRSPRRHKQTRRS